ncbi:phage antirepressor [Ruminococcaceae bacterium OttesenSCG-928-L11]|nr:phage antirepressor [Ruminococcaceae bacterium OttesenSCG-928-L11]
MNNTLQNFQHEEFGSVRVVQIDGESWFVGKDVADALGYTNGSRDINRHVDAEDRRAEMIPQYQNGTLVSKAILINESGLYSLILSSKLPTAKKFKRWVTSEILPSIRKHGAYVTDDMLDNLVRDPNLAYELFCKLQAERGKTAALEERVEQLAPKARYCDLILQCKNALPISLIAKDYDMSAVSFNRMLHDFGIQHKVRGTWLLYQKYSGKGYTASNTFYTPGGLAVMHTCWTQKGRLFLYNMLAYYGILPSMEKQDALYC